MTHRLFAMGILATVGSAVALGSTCYVIIGQTYCCLTFNKLCPGNPSWQCPSQATGGPYTLNIVAPAGPSQPGKTDWTTSAAGNCSRTPVTCGEVYGECIYGTPIITVCTQQNVEGDDCVGEDPES